MNTWFLSRSIRTLDPEKLFPYLEASQKNPKWQICVCTEPQCQGRGESEGQSWEGVKIVAVTAKKHVEFEITR